MSAVEQLYEPPSLKRAGSRVIPSGVEILPPEHKAVRLRLPKNATSLDFLRAVYKHPRMPMAVRLEAAGMALPFEHPRLVMITPANSAGSNEQRIIISGGLPRLPGTATLFPHSAPEPFSPPEREPEKPEPVGVGTCTVAADED
jgi:hypothetical protein